MDRFSKRQSVLLGYIPQRSAIDLSSSQKAADRSSDIDFNDVFGGPPRRSSMHEIRCSYSEATDNETVASRNSWNGVREKPVFGEEGLNRRHYCPSDNFFGDIFRGNGSLSSSPRKRDWDPYSSSPGSRVLSPAPTLPPKAEPFGTSPPAQFSLPAKLTKGMELSTFGSAPHSPYKSKDGASTGVCHYSSHLLRSSSLNPGYEERNDTRSSNRQSILSRESSLRIGDADIDTGGNSKMESNSSDVLTSDNQFHFSIYKWASKGVPLVMPLRGGNSSKSKENHATDRCPSADGWIESERELPTETLNDTKLLLNDGASADIKSFTKEHDKQKNSIPPDTSTQYRVETWPRADSGDTTSHKTGEKTKSLLQSEISLHYKLENVSVVTEESHKPELKPLCSLFYEQSNEEISEKTGDKESKVKGTKISSVVPHFSKNKKKQDGKRDSAEVGKGSRQGSPINSRDSGKTRDKGKVKEFIKIFSQDSLSKSKINVDPQSQSSRWKDTVNSKAEMETKCDKINEKIHMSSEHEKKSSPNTPIKGNGDVPHSEKHQSATKNTSHMSNWTSGRKDSSSSEALSNGLKAVDGDIDQSFQGNLLVKELTRDEDKLRNTGNDPQDIQVVDVKILKWSNGKEGNIRSLLSTLQYVLWTESGWKPVPLVDIIDVNAVKRSYQKALLCLHPDKLQQKGATSQQKYTAEKVFDILQDAWTHFNSVGSL